MHPVPSSEMTVPAMGRAVAAKAASAEMESMPAKVAAAEMPATEMPAAPVAAAPAVPAAPASRLRIRPGRKSQQRCNQDGGYSNSTMQNYTM
jgi:hypothetical protein